MIQGDGISLPGLSHKYLHRKLKQEMPGLIFWLPSKRDEHICAAIDCGIIGGFSCVFTRYHEKDVTKIRSDNGKLCQSCVGFDANSMYLGCLSDFMPVSIPALWTKDEKTNMFTRKRLVAPGSSSSEVRFCLYLERVVYPNNYVRHRYNGTQLRINSFSLDAAIEELKIGYLYMGCWWHKHRHCLNHKLREKLDEIDIVAKEKETERCVKFFTSIGYDVRIVWECEDKRTKKPLEFEEFLSETYHLPKVNARNYTQKDLVRHILNDEVFGIMTGVDIIVPAEKHDYFDQMPPIFEHRTITESDLCPYIKTLHEKSNRKFHNKKTLISGFKARNATLTTPLLRYLLLKGCIIENIQSFIQYKPYKAFESVAKFLIAKRIECEQNPDTKVLADFYKLIGNSLYGKNLEAKSKFLKIKFLEDSTACKCIMKPQFKYLEEFENGWSEVGMQQKRFKTDTLRSVGLFVLNYSKCMLLNFLYDFIDVFIDRSDYDILSTDTDCYYLALSSDNIENIVRKEKICEYNKAKKLFLSDSNDPIDKRVPGKWKLEWQGIGYIGLAPKLSYGYTMTDTQIHDIIQNLPAEEQENAMNQLMRKNKMAAKGVQRRNKLNYLDYLYILENQTEVKMVENKGLRFYKNAMRRYSVWKTGLSAFIYKRKLLEPMGIRTECLDKP